MDKEHAKRLLDQFQKLGKNVPNRQWAYDILRRAGKDANVTPAALEIARTAIKEAEREST